MSTGPADRPPPDDPLPDGQLPVDPLPDRARPDGTVADALAPPRPSAAALRLFLAGLGTVLFGVCGVLMLFTDLPVGYAIALLVLAVAAAVVLARDLRGSRR